MEKSQYDIQLFTTCDYNKITELSEKVFIEGHLEMIDDLITVILPLANVIYYRHIRQLDDSEYAKEDLISDAILVLYQDMSLRWDKYIYVESYYTYYSRILTNVMISMVHGYHNFYAMDDVDPDTIKSEKIIENDFDVVEMNMLKESINKDIIETATHILSCRKKNTKLLINILNCKYVDKSGVDSLRTRVRVLGIPNTLFNFYCEHVDYVYKLSYNYQYAMLGGNKKMINRITETLHRFEDVTYSMLSENFYDSIIPEMYAELGPEVTKKFVKTFSNRTVQVPGYKDFCDTLLGGVVVSLAGGDRSNLYKVAEEYKIPYKILARIYNRVVKKENNK